MNRDRPRTSPRKIPSQTRSRAVVEAILDGAVRVFEAAPGSPYAARVESMGSSVNRIAKVAGVSIGSLYQYFPGKDAIIAELVRRRMRETHEKLLIVLEQSVDLSLEEAVGR